MLGASLKRIFSPEAIVNAQVLENQTDEKGGSGKGESIWNVNKEYRKLKKFKKGKKYC